MKTKWIAIALAGAICLGCTACGTGSALRIGSAAASSASAEQTALSVDLSDMFTDRDYEVGYEDEVTVALSDSGTTADGDGVRVDGNIITITKGGTYLLTGTLSQGQIVVDAADTEKVQLVLDGVSISNSSSAAIYIRQADKVFLTTKKGSDNKLSVTGDYVQTDENNIDAVIFSKDDLTLNGQGTLTIDAAYGHGIVSKDDLVVTGGTYQITAASHGICGKDSVRIADGTFTITAGKDGIHAENADDETAGFVYIEDGSFSVTAEGDGVDASGSLTITGGSFALKTGGGSANASTTAGGQPNGAWGRWGMQDSATGTDSADSTASAKGLKSGTALEITGGTFDIDSSDDALHTNGDVRIAGGTLKLSSGDDGMHADNALTISDGKIAIDTSYEGIEGAEITISGGTIDVTAADDGLNAAGGNDGSSVNGRMGQNEFAADASVNITIAGGSLTVDASGDGIDSNGNLTIAGGTITVNGPSENGNGALDYNGTGEISGGTIFAAGSSGMAQGLNGPQASILYNLTAAQDAGTEVTLTDSSGNTVAKLTPGKQFQSIVISTEELKQSETYTLTVGSEVYSITLTDTQYSNAGAGGMDGKMPTGGGQPSGKGGMGGFAGGTTTNG